MTRIDLPNEKPSFLQFGVEQAGADRRLLSVRAAELDQDPAALDSRCAPWQQQAPENTARFGGSGAAGP
jgi:hypothetical protein